MPERGRREGLKLSGRGRRGSNTEGGEGLKLTPYLFLDINSPQHLHQEPLGVLQKLLDLKVCFELVKLLHLQVYAWRNDSQPHGNKGRGLQSHDMGGGGGGPPHQELQSAV